MDVLNKMKPGLDERLYERALLIELRRRGHTVESQKEFPVFYESELIGNLIPDLIVDDKVIVDPKVVTAFNEAHIAQMAGYLTITGLELALLLNFKSRSVGMETSRASAKIGIGFPRSSCLICFIRDLRVIRGSQYER